MQDLLLFMLHDQAVYNSVYFVLKKNKSIVWHCYFHVKGILYR